ncbi:Uncharacterized protein PBTT_09845 [Plasmodiophora brassicae]
MALLAAWARERIRGSLLWNMGIGLGIGMALSSIYYTAQWRWTQETRVFYDKMQQQKAPIWDRKPQY